MSVSPIPKDYPPLSPYLIVKGASQAIEFYQQAFGAIETMRILGPGGSISHAEIRIGSSVLMLSEENPAWGSKAPEPNCSLPIGLYLYVENVDAVFEKALNLGATVKYPLSDKFYGDRSGAIVDPFGHLWSLGSHIEDVSAEELQRRADEMAKQYG